MRGDTLLSVGSVLNIRNYASMEGEGEGRGGEGGGGSPVAGGSWFARRPNKKATNLYNGRMKENDEQGVSDEKGVREGGGQNPG